MTSVPASDLAKNFGEWHEKAMREPVVITKHGRESAVLISAETFRMLVEGYREVVSAEDLEAAVAASIERSEIPEQYRWNSDEAEVPDSRRGVALG